MEIFFGTHGLSLFSSGSPQKGELKKKKLQWTNNHHP